MAKATPNLAVTQDGEAYNKLQRPADYLLSTALPPTLTSATGPMSKPNKRKREQDAASDGKRLRVDKKSGLPSGGGFMRESGMRAMLPGLDNDEGQLSDSSTNEALAYLRSVRSEASTIPHLLVAPTGDRDNTVDDEHGSDTDDYDDQGLIYEDGVWMAVDNVHGATSSNYGNGYKEWDRAGADLDPQESYYDLLLRRFQSLRRKIAQAKANGINQPKGTRTEKSKKTRWPRNKAAWLQVVDKEYPTLSQVVHMNEHTLFSSIERCALYISKSDSLSHQKCCWIWTLLALTGEVGTLDSELISKLRELGVQAGRLGQRLQHNASRHQDFEDDVDDAEDMPCQNGKINDNSEEASTKVTVDRTEVREVETSHETSDISATSAHEEHHKDNQDANANAISDDEDDQTANTKPMSTGGHSPADHEHSLDGRPSKAAAISNGKEGNVEDKKVESLEEARARLLAQLGDRLVQPTIPLSRAEAERERRLMQEHNDQKMSQKQAIANDCVGHDVGARGDAWTVSDWDTQTGIDMILSVVAICYGQRDLVAFREVW